MDDLCTACLCTGRNLYFIGETGSYHLYSQILNEIPVYDFSAVCVRVCWECRALLRRFGAFKSLVKRSYSELLQQLHQNVPPCKSSLVRPPRLQAGSAELFSWPDPVKEEAHSDGPCEGDQLEDIKPVKEEPEVRHNEPEPFAEVEVVKERKKKTTTKVKKIGKGKKKKIKSKKKLEEKKINSKKKTEDVRSVSSEDSRLFIDDSDAGIGDEEIKTDKSSTKEVKEKKKESNINKDIGMEVEGVLPIEYELKENTRKTNGGMSPKMELVGDKPKCGECGKVFSSKKTYRYHLNVLHKGQNSYPCPRCGKVYQWKSNLGRHMRTHKARDSGELFCATCDKRFASVATFRQHLRVSRRHVPESEFSFMCNECGKKFVNKTRLRDHVDWEHLQKIKFRCQLCTKPFKCHTSLYVHMQNVHRDKQKENLCHICGKSYQNAAKLKYHIVAMHTSETPYRCAHCAAAFGWYSSLYRHVREVHYKMKLQPKKMRKTKRAPSPPLPQPPPLPPPPHHPHV